MQIVIDIPEKDYDKMCKGELVDTILVAIKNGTPLPKGHGRLIDADYEIATDGRTVDYECGYLAPTIIEADKESKE